MRDALAKLPGVAKNSIKVDITAQTVTFRVDPKKFKDDDALAALKSVGRGGSSLRK